MIRKIVEMTDKDCSIMVKIAFITGYCSVAHPEDKLLNDDLAKLSSLVWENYGMKEHLK